MIAALLVGWLLQRFAGATDGAMWGLLAGFVVALFVPAQAACALPKRPSPSTPPEGR